MKFQIRFVDYEAFEIFINSTEIKMRAKILAQLENIEDTGILPDADHLIDDIYEFKFKHGSNIARVLWTYDRSRKGIILITHGFIKKTQKTPENQIALAKRLLNNYYNERKRTYV